MGLDIARGKVSITPVVKIAADLDSDEQEGIHHNIKKTLSGSISYTMADANDKWAYTTTAAVTSNSNLIVPHLGIRYFTQGGTISLSDKVKYIYLKHTGVNATGDTSVVVYFTIDGSAPTSSNAKGLVLESNEGMLLKPTGLTVDNLHAATADSSEVYIEFAGILDDV